MTLTALASLIILIALPVSYGVVKAISFTYKARDAEISDSNKASKVSWYYVPSKLYRNQ